MRAHRAVAILRRFRAIRTSDDAGRAPSAVAALHLPPPQAAPAGGGASPIDTGVHARPKIEKPACTLSMTELVIGGLVYEYLPNAPGDKLLAALKGEFFKPEGEAVFGNRDGLQVDSLGRAVTTLSLYRLCALDLPETAAVLKAWIVAAAAADQPLYQVVSVPLTFAGCEQQPPRKNWRRAAVASRGVVPSLLSAVTNQRAYDWTRVMHYNPDAPHTQPVGVGDEPFLGSACQQGCAEAIARGRALGWKGRIEPLPVLFSHDDTNPGANGGTALSPLGVWLAAQPADIRRSVVAGEHVMLFPQLDLGKTQTSALKRDHRAATQECFQIFVDQFNEAYRRGFVVHGSHIKGCDINDVILFMPFALASSYDAVGSLLRAGAPELMYTILLRHLQKAAWITLNQSHKYCYVCPTTYTLSWEYAPSPLAPLPATEVDKLRRDANLKGNSVATRRARKDARKRLDDMSRHPEVTALDNLAMVQMGGHHNVVPDASHCCEGGICKCAVEGVKDSLGNAALCSDRPHGVAVAAAVVDDFVRVAGGHNTGYHRIPSVKGFTTIQVFTFMMIRSLLFSLLGALCSVSNLFNSAPQTALICVLACAICLVRQANAYRWKADTPGRLDNIFRNLQHWWGAAFQFAKTPVNWSRPKVHLPSHWRDLYERLGAPSHYSTMYYIEAMQRLLKAAWRFTSRRSDAAAQVLQRIGVLRWIHTRLLLSTGADAEPIAALLEDRATQAYLTGWLEPKAGVNALFSDPQNPSETSWNAACTKALRELGHPDIPPLHKAHPDRWHPRRGGTFVRKGIVAVSVPALPAHCTENVAGTPICAIFSGFEAEPLPGGAAAGVAPAPAVDAVRESSTMRFLIDYWVSYNATGLTDADANAIPARRLTQKELNQSVASDGSNLAVIDLAVGRWLSVQPTITATGDTTREKFASYVFQRVAVKPAGKCAIVDLAGLCQTLWAFPFLGDVDNAETFFNTEESKWSSRQWLICKKLF